MRNLCADLDVTQFKVCDLRFLATQREAPRCNVLIQRRDESQRS